MSGHSNGPPNACFVSNSFQHVQPTSNIYSYSSNLMSPTRYSTIGSAESPPNDYMQSAVPFPTTSL